MTPAEQIRSNIAELQSALLAAHPQIPTLLRTIHKQLAADPAVVTILTEEEVGIIVSGLKRQTAVEIVTKSKPASKTSKIKSMTLDDL